MKSKPQKKAILLHGTLDKEEYYSDAYPSGSNSHWFPWLQKQLMINDIYTQTPEIFMAFKPKYEAWKKELERYEIDKNTILVGHSCGGGFLLRWLSENKVNINKLVLVAPWLDPDREKTKDYFAFEIDPDLVDRTNQLHLFVSEDDMESVTKSVEKISKVLPNITMHEYKDKGHFTYEDLQTYEFPDLLEAILHDI